VNRTFERFAATTAVLSAAASLVFTVAFAVVVQEGERWAQWVSWTTLLLGGLVALPVVVALQARLGRAEPEFALVGLVLGVAGAIGAAVHGAYELSALANPPDAPGTGISAIDPRGVMTFAVTGLALGLFGWLIMRTGELPRRTGQLALVAAGLLVVVYVGRLTVLDPKADVIRAAALVSGLLVVPAFYVQLARALLRPARPLASPPVSGLAHATSA
jgi:hypothetical protein